MVAYMRSLDSSRIVIASITIAIMAVVTDWQFSQNMAASTNQGKFEPLSALGGALFIASCMGALILLTYVTLMHFYKGDIRIVRLALAGVVVALCAGIAVRWAWSAYITDYNAARRIVTKVTYVEDATLIGWLAFGLVFALCCTVAASHVERRS